MTNSAITARQARAILFSISSEAADVLRREFFEIEDQDAPLSPDQLERFLDVAGYSSLDNLEQPQVEEQLVEESPDTPVCPFCGAEASDLEPAGAEGTFLGDSVLLCRGCKKAHNIFSGVEVDLPKGRKSRKTPLNPQYKINKKVAAVEAAGGTLTYDKSTRLWALQLPHHKAPVLMASQEFSQVDHKTILDID